MAPISAALTTKVDAGSPYRLDKVQTLKASSALLKHIKTSTIKDERAREKKDLLAGDSSDHANAQPIWLVLTTKKHIITQPRLKPSKILLPHSINAAPDLSICLITAQPQRAFKDLIAHPSFPSGLAKRVTRVIDVEKLKKKYYSYESKRQLKDSHDLFFADDRIVTYLPKILGKTFYTTTLKRPIPVQLAAYKEKAKKKNAALPSTKTKKSRPEDNSICTPKAAAQEIERTLSMTQVNLSPSVTTSIRAGLSTQSPEQVAQNVEVVVANVTEKHVPRQWRGVKAIHIKGPNTMALPIWLADELWDDEKMVLEDQEAEEAQLKALQKGKRQRKLVEGDAATTIENGVSEKTGKKRKSQDKETKGEVKKKKQKLGEEGFSQEMKERREMLRAQKRAVKAALTSDEPPPDFDLKKVGKAVS